MVKFCSSGELGIFLSGDLNVGVPCEPGEASSWDELEEGGEGCLKGEDDGVGG